MISQFIYYYVTGYALGWAGIILFAVVGHG